MPDANGNFKGISVPASAWTRIFGTSPEHETAVRGECCYGADHENIGGCKDCPLNRDKPAKNL